MTNMERNLKAIAGRQGNTPTPLVPWTPTELKRFWALARLSGLDREKVHEVLQGRFGKKRLHDCTRTEFLQFMNDLTCNLGPYAGLSPLGLQLEKHHGCSEGQWRKIRWLQRELGWSDLHLWHYIKQHAHIDHIRWLCDVRQVRAVITGMEKIYGN